MGHRERAGVGADWVSAVLSLRPMTEADLPRMNGWANEPHVRRWWADEGGPLENTRANFLPMIEGADPTRALIVELDGVPIGHGQWCRWGDFPDDAARFGAGADEYCVDYFIGDPALVGRGLGTTLVGLLLADVRTWCRQGGHEASGFLVDVDPDNIASCRVLEKNGFARFPDPHPERVDPASGRTVLYRRAFAERF